MCCLEKEEGIFETCLLGVVIGLLTLWLLPRMKKKIWLTYFMLLLYFIFDWHISVSVPFHVELLIDGCRGWNRRFCRTYFTFISNIFLSVSWSLPKGEIHFKLSSIICHHLSQHPRLCEEGGLFTLCSTWYLIGRVVWISNIYWNMFWTWLRRNQNIYDFFYREL